MRCPAIDLLRRLLGLAPPDEARDEVPGPAGGTDVAPEEAAPPVPGAPPATPVGCPSCAFLLDPPPTRNRRCPRCRQPIVVRRKDGRLVLLTEAAVLVFEAERRRETDERTWAADRKRWLALAANVKAPVDRRARLARAPLTAAVVEASRALYLSTAEHAVREARRKKRWGDVGRIRREQAAALYRAAGSPVPPPPDITELHREGMSAVLRALAAMARDAEIVGGGCCKACRAADGTIIRIATELRDPRLPHDGCPQGLCGCDWWVAVAERPSARRRAPAAPPGEAVSAPRAARGAPGPTPTRGSADSAVTADAAPTVDDAEGDRQAGGVSASRSG